jgi:glycyl-tRNA synthetase
VANGVRLDLAAVLAAAAAVQPVAVSAEVVAEAHTFVTRRLEQMLVDAGKDVMAVRAVLGQVR